MLIKRNSFLAKIVTKLPRRFLFIQSARVGSDCQTYLRVGRAAGKISQ